MYLTIRGAQGAGLFVTFGSIRMHVCSQITGVQPMFQVFQQYPGVLEGDEAKKIIKSYNRVAKVLLEYEVIYHQAWLKQVLINRYSFTLFDIYTQMYRQFQSISLI